MINTTQEFDIPPLLRGFQRGPSEGLDRSQRQWEGTTYHHCQPPSIIPRSIAYSFLSSIFLYGAQKAEAIFIFQRQLNTLPTFYYTLLKNFINPSLAIWVFGIMVALFLNRHMEKENLEIWRHQQISKEGSRAVGRTFSRKFFHQQFHYITPTEFVNPFF